MSRLSENTTLLGMFARLDELSKRKSLPHLKPHKAHEDGPDSPTRSPHGVIPNKAHNVDAISEQPHAQTRVVYEDAHRGGLKAQCTKPLPIHVPFRLFAGSTEAQLRMFNNVPLLIQSTSSHSVARGWLSTVIAICCVPFLLMQGPTHPPTHPRLRTRNTTSPPEGRRFSHTPSRRNSWFSANFNLLLQQDVSHDNFGVGVSIGKRFTAEHTNQPISMTKRWFRQQTAIARTLLNRNEKWNGTHRPRTTGGKQEVAKKARATSTKMLRVIELEHK